MNDIISSRGNFSKRKLFLQGGNMHCKSGLMLSTDTKPRLKWTAELHEHFIEAVDQLGGPDSKYQSYHICFCFLFICFHFSYIDMCVCKKEIETEKIK